MVGPIAFITPPGVFDTRVLRSGSRYNNLRHHWFSTDEKLWLCQTLTVPSSSLLQIDDLIRMFCQRYALRPHVLLEWLLEYQVTGDILSPGYCILDMCLIDAIGTEAIVSLEKSLNENERDFSNRWTSFVRQQEHDTTIRRNITLNWSLRFLSTHRS